MNTYVIDSVLITRRDDYEQRFLIVKRKQEREVRSDFNKWYKESYEV